MSDIVVPAHVAPYVDVLGIDGAVEFLLTFGGAQIRLTEKPRRDSHVLQAVGRQKAIALASKIDAEHVRVPLAKAFIAQKLRHQDGKGVAEIARKLHVSDVTVRSYLRGDVGKRQFDFFGTLEDSRR